ncbi:MAG: apolipoprotein N-acyltransferase [Lentisphaerae bacterium]|nr:apolipoprotein N-acyltransferase [Lentisphaerota bacterium]
MNTDPDTAQRRPACRASRFPPGRGTALRALAASASGLLLAGAYPPFRSGESAWLAFVPLLVMARFTRPREAFRWGFLSGLTFWLLTLSWLLRLWQTGQMPVAAAPAVALGWLALAAYCALYTGAFAMLAAWIFGLTGLENRARNVGLVLLLPVLWVGLEYGRAELCTGFPWNQLGVSQFRNLAVIQVAEWGGVYAVSAVVMALNAALALTVLRLIAVYRENRPRRAHFELMAGLLAAALCWMHGMRAAPRARAERARGAAVRVAAIQPGIAQERKWPAGYAEEIHARLRYLTELVAQGTRPDLIVWPETAVPGFAALPDDESGRLARELAEAGPPILAGTMDVVFAGGRELWFNSAILFEAGGVASQVYRKRHLVPFGEYIPFDDAIPALKRVAPLGFSCAAGATSTVFRLASPPVTFSTLICFEDTVARLARRSVLNGAGFLVVQTNDAWFDRTPGPVQHLSHCVLRCVENRVDAVRAANTGVTCMIDAAGRVETIAADDYALAAMAGKTSEVRARPPGAAPTFYTRVGDWGFAIPCAAVTAALLGAAIFSVFKGGRDVVASPDRGT